MARVTVTAFTAARMLAIENSTIVGGRVTNDNLVLTTRDGTSITAGNVRGQQGVRGEPGGVWDATVELKGALKLAGNIGGSADIPTVTGSLDATVDLSKSMVRSTWLNPTTSAQTAVEKTAKQMLTMLMEAYTKASNSVVAKGKVKVLWSGTEAEYLALSSAEKNDPGFNGIVY